MQRNRMYSILIVLLSFCVVSWAALREEFVSGYDEFGNKLTNCSMCDYVYRDDGFFSWELNKTEFHPGVNTYWLNVTSQKWFDETWTDEPVWVHWVVLHVPVAIRFMDSAFMFISSGKKTDGPPSYDSDHVSYTAQMALDIGVVTAVVRQIPNQPLVYTDDPDQKGRTEDDSIAYTWRVFLDQAFDNTTEPDPEIVLRNPMCKGAVKSMDAVTEFVQQQYSYDITQWMVAGQSKRGWTTWIVGAMDDRVIAMAPIVLSCLNMVENFHHYFQSYNGWPYYIWDYWSQGIMQFINDPEIYQLEEIVDPFRYSRGMAMPKLMISSASDEFFLLDDSWYFKDQLPGETHLWMVENSGHSISKSDSYDELWDLMATFYLSVILGEERPTFEELRTTDGSGGNLYIRTPLDWVPIDVTGFWADSVVPDRREWRLSMMNESFPIPKAIDQFSPVEIDTNIYWDATTVNELGNHIYQVHLDYPTEGYRAFYMTITWTGVEGRNYTWSSEAHVIPEGLPYPKCTTRLDCFGKLY